MIINLMCCDYLFINVNLLQIELFKKQKSFVRSAVKLNFRFVQNVQYTRLCQ